MSSSAEQAYIAHRAIERYLTAHHSDEDPVVLICALSYAVACRVARLGRRRSEAELDQVFRRLARLSRRHVRFLQSFYVDDEGDPHPDPIRSAPAPASTVAAVSQM